MTYGKLVRWGNGLKVVQAGKSEEELGEINKQHNWVIEQRDIPIRLDDRISFGELKDFGIISEPSKEGK